MPTLSKRKVHTVIKPKKPINTSRIDPEKYYGNNSWKLLSYTYRTEHPLCEECLRHDRVTPTEHVHHIISFFNGRTEEDRLRLLLNPNNLIALCKDCHYAIHNKINKYSITTGCSSLTQDEYNKAHGILST